MNLKDLMDAVQDMSGEVFYSAEQTDCYDVGYWVAGTADKIREENLLSLRVFDENKEVRLSRSDIGQEFALRIQDDRTSGNGRGSYFDQWQLLDVDDRRSHGTTFVTTGGGRYEFPLTELRRPAVLIRHYTQSRTGADESGLTYVSDWRCVTFGEWREVKNG